MDNEFTQMHPISYIIYTPQGLSYLVGVAFCSDIFVRVQMGRIGLQPIYIRKSKGGLEVITSIVHMPIWILP